MTKTIVALYRVTHVPHNNIPVSPRPVYTTLDEEPPIGNKDADSLLSVMVTAPTIDDLPTPEATASNEESTKQATYIEPTSLILEEQLDKEHETSRR